MKPGPSTEPGAWTCGLCGFRGFWSGGPHCSGLKRGDTVYFRCGSNPYGYHGTVTSLTTDEQGGPAAWVRVAGFPAWVHLQALDELVRTCGVCPDCRGRSDVRPDCRRHALQEVAP